MPNIRLPLLLPVMLLAGASWAQRFQPSKVCIALNAYIDHIAAPGEEVDVYVHGPREQVARAVRAHGGTVKMDRPGLVSARVPAHRIRQLADEPAVERFEFAMDPGFIMNDSMRVKNRVVPIHLGQAPLREAYDGQNVMVGIIDSGLDWQHPDFRNADGSTRIHAYWDQTLPVGPGTPQPYNYGRAWTRAQIDAGQMTAVDQPEFYGHGTTVAGTAAGNGLANGRHKGVAPKSDLIIVSANFGPGNFRARVADAVKYIIDEATALGRPVVINASLGTYLGSHDGLDASALFIDDLLQQAAGRVLVCAGGNSNTFPRYHVRTVVDADTAFTWYRYNATSGLGYGAVYFEVWADTAAFNNVHYAIGADKNPPYAFRGRTPFHTIQQNLGGLLRDTLWSVGGNRLAIVEFYAALRGGQYQLQVHLPEPDSTEYRFRFMTTGQGLHDVWSATNFGTSLIQFSTPNPGGFPAIVHYVHPDRNMHIVDSWACSPHAITVANYHNEAAYVQCNGTPFTGTFAEGDIAGDSSLGPTRTGLVKPDVAASGTITISAGPLSLIATLVAANDPKVAEGCMHIRNGGTSIASPVVAGTAALFLQKCPQATHQQVRDAVIATAYPDNFTGAVPNTTWGHGKLDAFAALLTTPTEVAVSAPPGFCQGTEVSVEAEEGLQNYTWSDGLFPGMPVRTYGSTAPLVLMATDAQGCRLFSDTLHLEEYPQPQPTIDVVAYELTSSPAQGYQWLLDGEPIPGATGPSHTAVVGGWYSVQVTDANGCSGTSEPVQVLIAGQVEAAGDGFALWPSPTRDLVSVALPAGLGAGAVLRAIDARGRVVAESSVNGRVRIDLPLREFAAGTYTVRLEDNGAVWQARFVKLP